MSKKMPALAHHFKTLTIKMLVLKSSREIPHIHRTLFSKFDSQVLKFVSFVNRIHTVFLLLLFLFRLFSRILAYFKRNQHWFHSSILFKTKHLLMNLLKNMQLFLLWVNLEFLSFVFVCQQRNFDLDCVPRISRAQVWSSSSCFVELIFEFNFKGFRCIEFNGQHCRI